MTKLEDISQVVYAYKTVDIKEKYTDEGLIDVVKSLTYQKLLFNNGYEFSENTSDKMITSILFFEDNEIGVDDTIYHVVEGDVLLLLNINNYKINYPKSFNVYKFYYKQNINVETNNENNYTVLATLSDNYKISVTAKSKEHALEIAYGIPLDQWTHLEDPSNSNIRPIIRKSYWGNLKIESE